MGKKSENHSGAIGDTTERWRSVRASGGYPLKVRGFELLLEERSDAVDDFVERGAGTEAGEGLELFDGRDAPHHVLEAGFISFIVGNILDGRRASGAVFDSLGESFDGDFLGAADVDNFADGAAGVHEANEAFDSVAHVAEAAGLFAVAVDADGGVVQRGLDEIGENHSIASGLARAHGIEQTHHDDGKLLFLPVREGQKLVESFGGGVAPAAFGGGAEDEIGVLVKGNVGVFSVDLGSGGGQHEFLFLAGRFEYQLRAVNIGFDGLDGTFDNEFDADGGSKVHDDIGIVDELGNQLTILEVVEVILHAFGRFQVADVVHTPSRKIVEQDHAIAAIKQPFCQM